MGCGGVTNLLDSGSAVLAVDNGLGCRDPLALGTCAVVVEHGSGGVTELPGKRGANLGLATWDRVSLDSLEHPFVLCLASKAAGCALLT